MDLDQDGINDIITGSYSPGDLYFFKGAKDRSFAKGEKIYDKDGKILNVGTASTPFAIDWDKDGDLDLMVGDQRGQVHFVANESGDRALKFGVSKKISVGGKPIMCGHGDSQPVPCDYDGDGKLDMLLGCGDGTVLFYRGQGKAEPTFDAPVNLVSRSTAGGDVPTAPGMRVKLCLADFNADGVVDLLVGDFGSTGGGARKDLTDEEKKAYDDASKRSREISIKISEISQKLWDEALKPLGKKREELTKDEMLKVAKEISGKMQKDEDYKKLAGENAKLSQEMRKYVAARTYLGNVWLFAGKAADRVETPSK